MNKIEENLHKRRIEILKDIRNEYGCGIEGAKRILKKREIENRIWYNVHDPNLRDILLEMLELL